MLNARFDVLGEGPFQRLDRLLHGSDPGAQPILMSLGEPQHPYPDFVGEVLSQNRHLYGRYPPLMGTPEFRTAAANWLARRYALPGGLIDPDHHIVPLSGTREGLYMIAQAVVPETKAGARPVVLLPSPLYQTYAGAAAAVAAEAVFLPATAASRFLPDLDAIAPTTLERTAAFYLCSPGNPQGMAADAAYWRRLIDLARRFDFVVVADECYAEIYLDGAPAGALEACAADGDLSNVVVFHSLSKRSSVPGLRSGFAAGDADILARFRMVRAYGAAVPPLPVLAASTALWNDDDHAFCVFS